MSSSSRADVSKWVFIIALYIIVSTFVFSLGTEFATDFGLNNVNNSASYSVVLTLNTPFCDGSSSRGYFSTGTLNFSNVSAPLIPCDNIQYSRINPDGKDYESMCNSFSGCTFVNNTGLFSFLNPTTCSGTLNFSYYGITPYTSIATPRQLYQLTGVKNVERNCVIFGYDWNNNTNISTDTTIWGSMTGNNGATSFISTLLGFNINLGIPEPYQTLFNMVFVFIPRMILIFALIILIVG